jgi:hypothetical protein
MALTTAQLDFVLSDTLEYIETVHNETIEDYFKPIIKAVDDPKYQRIAIKACHAVGKTFGMARIIESLMSTNDYIKIISTAPTFRQVHDLLWKEIHSAHEKKPAMFRRGQLNQTEWWINSETFARGFSPQKRVKSETGQGTDSAFQGYHAKYWTVVVFDEAVGVEPQIWEQVEGLLTSGVRILFLAIANPTSRNCKFFKCFQDRSWKTFSITCFDTPNLKASGINSIEQIEKEISYLETLDDEEALARLSSYPCPKPYLINTRWVIEKAIEWGTDHPLFMGKVLGEFPDADGDVLVSEQDILNAQNRESKDLEKEETGYIGLDVARFGVDKSVLTSMIDTDQLAKKSMSKNDTNQVVGHAINFIEEHQEKYPQITKWRLAVDGGFGHGVIDRLRELKELSDDERIKTILENVEILEINFGSTDWVTFNYGWVDEAARKQKEDDRKVQEDRENYCNFKAKMFDLLSRDIKKNIKMLPDPVFAKQLPTIRKDVDSKGRLKIESKEDYKERTGETSPDEADSFALCNFARYFAVKPLSIIDIFNR